MKTIIVKFKENGKEYHFNDNKNETNVGDYVVVCTVNGTSIVQVIGTEEEYDSRHTPIVSLLKENIPNWNIYSMLTFEMGKNGYLIKSTEKAHDKLYLLNRLMKKHLKSPNGYTVIEKPYLYDDPIIIVKIEQEMSVLVVKTCKEYVRALDFEKEYLLNIDGVKQIIKSPIIKGKYHINIEKGAIVENCFKYQLPDYYADGLKDYFRECGPEGTRVYITYSTCGLELAIVKDEGETGEGCDLFPESRYYDWVHRVMGENIEDMSEFWLDDLSFYEFTYLKSRLLSEPMQNDTLHLVKSELYAIGKYESFVFIEENPWSSEDEDGIDYEYSIYTNTVV